MVAVAHPSAEQSIIEIEIDGPRNQSCIFRPLQRRLRGRFDLRRCAEPAAMTKHTEHPDCIPGQRLRLNTVTGKAELIEPLRLPEFAAIRERYEVNKRGEKVHSFPEHEAFESVDVKTWLYWLAVEVKAGMARLLSGVLPDPDKIDGVRRNFYTAPTKTREDKMATAIDRMAAATENNTRVLAELLKRLAPVKQ